MQGYRIWRFRPTILLQLSTFHPARTGPRDPFYFYDPCETVPKFSYSQTTALQACRAEPLPHLRGQRGSA